MHRIFKSYKFRMYPNKEQELLLNRHFGSVRFVYNYFLAQRIEHYNETKKTLGKFEQSRALTQLKKKDEYSWLNEVSSVALINALENLDVAYKNFFRRVKGGAAKKGFPKFKSKKDNNASFSIQQSSKKNRAKYHYNFRIHSDSIQLPKFSSPIKTVIDTAPQGDPFNVTVSRTPGGDYYVAVMCKEVHHNMLKTTGKAVGVDLGLKEFVITSDGDKFESAKRLRNSQAKLKYLSKQLSKKVKGSGKRNEARIKLAKLHENTARLRKLDINLVTKKLVQKYDVICVENLNVAGMLKNKRISKSIADAAFGMFRLNLEQKAAKQGKEVVVIDRWFASSQLCSDCGHKNVKMKNLRLRELVCDNCGTIKDRDINAAINIRNEGLRILTESVES